MTPLLPLQRGYGGSCGVEKCVEKAKEVTTSVVMASVCMSCLAMLFMLFMEASMSLMSLFYVTYAIMGDNSITLECIASNSLEAVLLTGEHVHADACVQEVSRLALEDVAEPYEDWGW